MVQIAPNIRFMATSRDQMIGMSSTDTMSKILSCVALRGVHDILMLRNRSHLDVFGRVRFAVIATLIDPFNEGHRSKAYLSESV